ncbi:hypothetical protein GCM10009804_37500 [Kribbella hippodromi]|uniref:LysM domain-containing protein n=1 Tax=Kribbella hippodromi TaxID=434347 RepID=A0ABN2DJY7_9ACTN
MNATIRLVKGTIAVLALAAVAVLLRWITAGSITGVRTYDLDSLTVLAISTVAWIAYAWLALAVLTTALEQLPGLTGALAGTLSRHITTGTARTLLRSGLGVAAVTPLTLTTAQATPTQTHQTTPTPQAEPASNLKIPTAPTARTSNHTVSPPTSDTATFRATEPASTIKLGPEVGGSGRRDTPTHRTSPGAPGTPGRGTTPGPGAVSGRPTPADQPGGTRLPADRPAGKKPTDRRTRIGEPDRRTRIGVPDRPTDGAPIRYTDVRAAAAIRVVVRDGDSLWTLAARELGTGATDDTIATRWLDWYAANRQLIGPNPNLLIPGQVLQVPPIRGGAPSNHGGGVPSTGGEHVPPTQGDHLPPTDQEK